MLVGNSPRIAASLFAQGYTIPAVIANELQTPANYLHRSALVELGLVLFLVTVVVNVLARLLIHNVGKPRSKGRGLSFWRRPAPSANGRAEAPLPTGPAPDGTAPERTTPLVSGLHNPWAQPVDRFMTWALGACLVLILVPLFHILFYIAVQGLGKIPINIGMLGADYPGYYPLADDPALAQLMARAAHDRRFYQSLKKAMLARRKLFAPAAERASLMRVVREVLH